VTPAAHNSPRLLRPSCRRFSFRLPAAFSLVGLSVAILVLSLVAALAVPAWSTARRHARSNALAADLKTFAAAFQSYAHARGDWPAATLEPAEIPPGMQPFLPATSWARVTPVGGAYAWARDTLQQGARYRAAVLILSVGDNRVTGDRQLLLEIDRQLDDGNLDTGRFRLGFRNQPVYVIEH
jgi:type II secretory pathway pseudopilin PulG